MPSSPPENYLFTEIMTATPQKLHLMLIEAAIRSAQRGRQKWQVQQDDEACEALIHAQQIVGELLASLDREVDPDLVKRVASVYLFVFRSLMEANYEHSEEKLDNAIRVLQLERETWRQVCEQLGSNKPAPDQTTGAISEQSSSPPLPRVSPDADSTGDAAASGFSVEA